MFDEQLLQQVWIAGCGLGFGVRGLGFGVWGFVSKGLQMSGMPDFVRERAGYNHWIGAGNPKP